MKNLTGTSTIMEQKRQVKTIEVNGEKFEFEASFGGTFSIDLAIILALLSLDDPRINKIIREFQISIKDKNGKTLEF